MVTNYRSASILTIIVNNPIHILRQDKRYLKPHVEDVLKEEQERLVWDTLTVERK